MDNLPSSTKYVTIAPNKAIVPAETPDIPLNDRNLLERSIMERMCLISSRFVSIILHFEIQSKCIYLNYAIDLRFFDYHKIKKRQ